MKRIINLNLLNTQKTTQEEQEEKEQTKSEKTLPKTAASHENGQPQTPVSSGSATQPERKMALEHTVALERKMAKWPAGAALSICIQWVKCGRANCRCTSGARADRHRAHYAFWREKGKLRKCYLSPGEVELLQPLVEDQRQAKRRERQHIRNTLTQWREMAHQVRSHEEAHRQLKQQEAAGNTPQS